MELMLSSVAPRPERQCADRPPAPGDLGLVQSFVNSFSDLDTRQDRFATPAALVAWLLERDLIEPGTGPGAADLHRALEVREGLRALLFANNGSEPDHGAIRSLNRALGGPALSVVLDPLARPDFRTQGDGLDAVLALIAGIVAVAQLDGRWSRLKACRGEHCGWAFYDHSRNQAGNWCAMSVCGSRAKAREYRRRKRSSAS